MSRIDLGPARLTSDPPPEGKDRANDDATPDGGPPPAVGVRRFAVVEFEGASRRVRRVVTLFASPQTAELFAVESGWTDWTVGPASIVTALRE